MPKPFLASYVPIPLLYTLLTTTAYGFLLPKLFTSAFEASRDSKLSCRYPKPELHEQLVFNIKLALGRPRSKSSNHVSGTMRLQRSRLLSLLPELRNLIYENVNRHEIWTQPESAAYVSRWSSGATSPSHAMLLAIPRDLPSALQLSRCMPTQHAPGSCCGGHLRTSRSRAPSGRLCFGGLKKVTWLGRELFIVKVTVNGRK